MQELTGKTVLITGASRGIGAAAARAFAAAGAQVALAARGAEALETLAAEIGEQALAIPCDVSRYADVEAAVKKTQAHFGALHVLTNNAAVIAPIGHIHETDPDSWSRAVDINLKGVYYGFRAALPVMLAQGGGTIITLSSGAAHRPLDGWGAYCATKAGAAMLHGVAGLELEGRGIRLMGLSPGTVRTEMQVEIKASGINRVSQLEPEDHIPPEWPAQALVWMCTAAADPFVGTEISLRDPEMLRRIGIAS